MPRGIIQISMNTIQPIPIIPLIYRLALSHGLKIRVQETSFAAQGLVPPVRDAEAEVAGPCAAPGAEFKFVVGVEGTGVE